MEGWLQVPPSERNINLIGRAGWKQRYVRFSNNIGSKRPSLSTSSSARPTTAGSMNNGESSSKAKIGLERSLSTNQVSALNATPAPTAAAAGGESTGTWTLAVYKHKNDPEPIAQYPIERIASCYVGDVAASKKKSLIMPTLVVNLRTSTEHQLQHSSSTSRAFRRRSHEAPSKDGSRKEGATTTLLFRTNPDEPYVMGIWVREIRSRLIPGHSTVRPIVVDTALREGLQENDYDTPVSSPSSLFLINGEPSTALLSPSIRSKTSNLSSIDSDDRSSMASTSSDTIGSPRDASEHQRPHSATIGYPPWPRTRTGSTPAKGSAPVGSVPGRRETILDRFFASSPASRFEGDKPMSSMARFEALMNELEAARGGDPLLEHSSTIPSILTSDRPRRIPSPTQRALEYVSSGRIRSPPPERGAEATSDEETSDEEQEPDELLSPTYVTTPTFSNLPMSSDRSDSDNISLDTIHTTCTTSTTGTASVVMEMEPPAAPLVPASSGKRHSLADFSLMRLSTPPIFGLGGVRRGSHGDLGQVSESLEGAESPVTASGTVPASAVQEFGGRSPTGHLKV